MTHHEMQERLEGFLAGTLMPAEARLVEAHLTGCEECRREKEALARLLARAAELPRGITPPRDLWPEIAARLETKPIVLPGGVVHAPGTREISAGETPVISLEERRAVRAPLRVAWTTWAVRAAAALLLVVLSSAITVMVMRQGQDGPQLVQQVPPATARPGVTALVAFGPTEAEYIRTADDLAAVLDSRRDSLSPETVRIVEENLRIIDRAIAEARAALEADPNNVDLTHMLGGMYQQKVEMLQNAAQLPLRI